MTSATEVTPTQDSGPTTRRRRGRRRLHRHQGVIALTTAPTSVREDDSATEVTVTATLGGSVTLSSATEVTVSVGGGSATSGTDYTAVENFKLTIAATESSGTGTFIDVTGTASGFTVTKAEMTLTDDADPDFGERR